MHLRHLIVPTILAALVDVSTAQENITELVGQLRLAPNANARLELLKDEDLVFNFLNATSGILAGAGGRTVGATAGNFPGVVGNGIAMTIGFLEPCGLNLPHTHPRATEINFVVNGSQRTGLLAENGARFIVNDVPAGTASVFPQGAIHFEMNTACEPTMFVAAFNNEDPGVDTVAQRYFGLPPDIVGASLGGLGVIEIAELQSKIPDNVAVGTDECLKRCGLTRPATQPIAQQQPRIPGNALPSNFNPTTTSSQHSSTSTKHSTSSKHSTSLGPISVPIKFPQTSSTTIKGGIAVAVQTSSASKGADKLAEASSKNAAPPTLAPSSGTVNSNGPSGVVIALVVINGVLVIGLLAIAMVFVKQRSNRSAFEAHKYEPPSADLRSEEYGTDGKSTYYDPYTSTKIAPTQ